MVTDTVFRKSSFGNLFFKKVFPGTSKHRPYHKDFLHADFLVFCLKFRLSPVCEYLDYYYKITNDYYNIYLAI